QALIDEDFAVTCPLVRPGLPQIRFLYVRSRFCSTLLSDAASRRRPSASLALHLHQVVQGTCTPKLSNMLGTRVSRSRGRIVLASIRVQRLPTASRVRPSTRCRAAPAPSIPVGAVGVVGGNARSSWPGPGC